MGTTLSAIINQGFPPKSKFSVDQIPDLTGRVVLVTGTCAFSLVEIVVPEGGSP
ncbi:hypothetical protein TRAPUB_5477 [Trametes pubescens]|uniref:Uncharacterized protein n=1 Tax=Trametes pubescens TaxID=154538 RepID=A0A1M2V8G4_TRAPU|nr:hypothetical protein TRAPUB_5477 [Trametes pubescens]